jgi:type II secretory ATPase GspE/PulE/Tfp pilus assembly ATPase PilB-like protein
MRTLCATRCCVDAGEEQTPVLLFPSTEALRGYAMQGKSSREGDPIVEANNKVLPALAVGQRDMISSLINNFRSGAGARVTAASRMSNYWVYKTTDKNTPGQKELARLIDHAYSEGASDIAFESQANGAYEASIRVDGILYPAYRGVREGVHGARTLIPAPIAEEMVNFLQSKSGATRHPGWLLEPADGNMRFRSAESFVDLRVSIIPRNFHNDMRNLRSVSIRLHDQKKLTASEENVKHDLARLSMPEHVMRHLRNAVLRARRDYDLRPAK